MVEGATQSRIERGDLEEEYWYRVMRHRQAQMEEAGDGISLFASIPCIPRQSTPILPIL
jgi:hypothetical protein